MSLMNTLEYVGRKGNTRMLNKLNVNKKELPETKVNAKFNRSLPGTLSQSFISYLNEFNQGNDLKEIANEINWKLIIEIYKNECNELRSQFLIPKVIDEIKVKNLDTTFYSLVIKTTVHSLFYSLYLLLKDHIASKESSESLNYNLTKNLIPVIKQYISSYYFQLELTRIKNDRGKQPELNIINKFKEIANLGKAFSKGKNFTPKEITVFKLIFQQYNKAIQAGIKKSYKAIAYFLGKNELELHTKEEQYWFYKRFMAYKNCMQK